MLTGKCPMSKAVISSRVSYMPFSRQASANHSWWMAWQDLVCFNSFVNFFCEYPAYICSWQSADCLRQSENLRLPRQSADCLGNLGRSSPNCLGNLGVSPDCLGNLAISSPNCLGNLGIISSDCHGSLELKPEIWLNLISPDCLGNMEVIFPDCLGKLEMKSPDCLGNSELFPDCLGNLEMISPDWPGNLEMNSRIAQTLWRYSQIA